VRFLVHDFKLVRYDGHRQILWLDLDTGHVTAGFPDMSDAGTDCLFERFGFPMQSDPDHARAGTGRPVFASRFLQRLDQFIG
jgi:hypothetical protein